MLKRTFISDYNVEPNGVLQIRITVQVAHDDGKGIRNLNHRTTIHPGTDPVAQIEAVNANLADMNAALLGDDDAAFIIALVGNIHTRDVVDAFQNVVVGARMEMVTAKADVTLL